MFKTPSTHGIFVTFWGSFFHEKITKKIDFREETQRNVIIMTKNHNNHSKHEEICLERIKTKFRRQLGLMAKLILEEKTYPKKFKKQAFFILSGSEKNSKNFENRKKISKHVKTIPNDHINFYKQKKSMWKISKIKKSLTKSQGQAARP